MSKRQQAYVGLKRRVRPRFSGPGDEHEAQSRTSGAPPSPKKAVVELVGGSRFSGMNSVQFDVESVVDGSDEDEPAPADTDMHDSGTEEDVQSIQDFNEERVSTRSISSRIPTPAPARQVRRKSSKLKMSVDMPPRTPSRSTRHQTEQYEDEDVEMHDDSVIIDRRTGLMTPRITKTPSSSAPPPMDEDEEELPTQYEPQEEEIDESEELVEILKEIQEDDESEEGDEVDDLPIRYLDDFALYDVSNDLMVPFWDLALLSPEQLEARVIVASGVVSPQPKTDEDGEEIETGFDPENAPRVRLTGIVEIDYNWWYEKTGRLDTDIYVRTAQAWYSLRTPCDAYERFMTPFSLAHCIVCEMAEYALVNKRALMSDFLDEVDAVHEGDSGYITREQCEDALKDVRVLHMIDNLRADAPPIRKTTIFRRLDTAPAPSAPPSRALSTTTDFEDATPSTSTSRPHIRRRKSSSKNPELAILEGEKKTVLTPIIGDKARMMRYVEFMSEEQAQDIRREKLGKKAKVHEFDPEKMVWGRKVHEDEDGVGYYESVRIDGVRYKPGDFVMVQPGEDGKKSRAQAGETVHTTNIHGHTNWFAHIICLHDGGNSRGFKFHAQWLTHSSKTLLQEFSHPNELLWMKECEDIVLASIIQKISMKVLPKHGAVGEEPAVGELRDDEFFHRHLYYDEDIIAWADLPSDIAEKALKTCEPHKQCIPCGLHELDDRHEATTVLDDDSAFETAGVQYHRQECIYLYNYKNANDVFELAQVLDWRWKERPKSKRSKKKEMALVLTVRYFHRHDDVTAKERRAGTASEDWSMDERHIFLTGKEEEVDADRVAGKFYCRREEPNDRWKRWLVDNPDVFYCTHGTELAGKDVDSSDDLHKLPRSKLYRCESCFKSMMDRDKRLRDLQPLKGVEIFAGAGGFSEGMKDMVDTGYFIEYSPSCAKTLQANHPDAVVYNYDCNKVLQHEIDLSEGKDPEPLYGADGSQLPPLPQPGEVDIIYGGPPCQSFSKANHAKKADDPRSMLALVLLSFAERLQPKYVIIENVVGFAEHKAELADGRIVDNAMLKVIPCGALALGYQVHIRVLQAAQCGVAQGRRRVIVIMAKRGISLPQHPLPTHVYDPPMRVKLPTGVSLRGLSRPAHGFLTEASRAAYCDRAPSAAPHCKVTVEQAICDLPPFHWQRPGREIKITSTQRKEEAVLRSQGIPVVDAITPSRVVLVGFIEPTPYGDVARSLYQRNLRSDAGDDLNPDAENLVSMHYTKSYSAEAVERVTAIPIVAGANWQDLPSDLPLRIGEKARERNSNVGKGLLLRLPADGVFTTSTTDMHPLSKAGAALHYNQRRIMTVREYARAQGFPDAYQFCSANEHASGIRADQQRQIGNAVPVPLGRAIGEFSLRPAVLAWREQQAHDGTPEI